MTRQDDLHTLLEDLLMMRAELEAMDVSRGGWEAALKQRHLRQQRHDLEDALQERMAELGSMVLDALMERREDALLSIARGPLGVATLPEPAAQDEDDDDPDDSSGPGSGQGDVPPEPPTPPSASPVGEVASDSPPASPQALTPKPQPKPKPEPEPEAALKVKPNAASPAPAEDASTSERAKVLFKPVMEQDPAKQLMDAWMSNSLSDEQDAAYDVNLGHHHELLLRAWEVGGATPVTFNSKGNARVELSNLQRLVNHELNQWRYLDQAAHVELCSWTAARMRALDDAFAKRFPKRKDDREALGALFPRMIRHIKGLRLDYVHGLALTHQPRHGASWSDDARFFERALRQRLGLETPLKAELKPSPSQATCKGDFNLDDALRCLTERVREGMEPEDFVAVLQKLLNHKVAIHQETRVVNLAVEFADALEGDKALKPLRRAVKKKIEEASREAEASLQPALPVDWPWFEHTLGKRCELIGGDPRQHRIQAIQDAFGFDDLQWCESGPRHVQSLIERVKSGKVDMVIILRCFCAHRISIPLFKLSKSGAAPDFKLVQADAYGIQQLRAGVERFMQEAEA